MTRAALRHLLAMLRLNKQCLPKQTPEPDAITIELKAFDCYLADVRGLSPATRSARLRHVRDFLRQCFGTGPIHLGAVDPADVVHFISHYTATWAPASISAANVSLRSYFSFRTIKGEQTAALSASLPQVAQWRLAGLPQQLSNTEIQQLLNAFDRRTAIGKRDYAMTRCLLDLGLRQSEVAGLQLGDIDWRSGILTIRGKGKRVDRLPLPQATGRAIVQYLQDGRPQTSRHDVFVRQSMDLPDRVLSVMRFAMQQNAVDFKTGFTAHISFDTHSLVGWCKGVLDLKRLRIYCAIVVLIPRPSMPRLTYRRYPLWPCRGQEGRYEDNQHNDRNS